MDSNMCTTLQGGIKVVNWLAYLVNTKGRFKMKWLVDNPPSATIKKDLALEPGNHHLFRPLPIIVKEKVSKINIRSSKSLFVDQDS